MLRKVNIDGTIHPIADSRIEGDQFAYINYDAPVTVGAPLTDLAPIQKAIDSTDGSLLYVPSLHALFSPTASSDANTIIWSSTVGDKGYQLKATLTSGALTSAVINEAAAEAGLIITDAEWSPVLQQYLGKNPAHFDPTGTYLITNEAKAIANKLITINMAEQIIKSPDKFQIEIKAMLSSFANCVFNDFSQTDMSATFKVLGNIPYIHPMSGNVESLELDVIGPKLKNNGTIAGLIIKEPQPSEDDIIIEYTDVVALQSAATEPYTPVTTAAAKELGEKIYNNPRKRIFVHYDFGGGVNFYQELKSTAPFPVNMEPEGDFAYIFADLAEDGYNMCIRVFTNGSDVTGATAFPHYMTTSEYALICDNSETTSDPFLTDDTSIWVGKSLRTNCFGLSAAGGTDKVFYKHIVDKAEFTGTEAAYYDTFTYELEREFTIPASTKNYTSLKNINVYYDGSLEVVGILVVVPPKNESVAFNISTDDYGDIKYNTEILTTNPYVTTDLAKSIGKKLLGHFKNPDGFEVDHFTVSDDPTSANAFFSSPISFYTYADHEQFTDDIVVIKFTTTAEIYNGNITVFYDRSDSTEALGMRIDDKPEEFVRISKEYMEVPTSHASHPCLEASITGTTLNITHKNESHISSVIHVPKSVLFTSPSAFELKFAPNTEDGWEYTPDAKIEISKDGINWTHPVWDENNGISLKADTLNDELGKYSVFIKSDNHINSLSEWKMCGFSQVSGTNIEVSGILDAMWGGKPMIDGEAAYMFYKLEQLTSAENLVLPKTTTANCYNYMFYKCESLTEIPILPATTLAEGCYDCMFYGCISLTKTPALPVTSLAERCYAHMFAECTSLTSAPALPATTMVTNCYTGMFEECTALTVAPELPATILAEECYNAMFEGCTALTKPIILPEITTLDTNCMRDMFCDCTGIKWAASGTPYIIKTTDGSTVTTYTSGMFEGNGGSPLPETTGTPKLNTTYYLDN